MATLSSLDIEKLFSGAPQYFDRSEGHFTGAPHPSVAFPWDDELAIRDLTDHTQIEDEAWGCITAWPHITRDVRRGPSASASRKVAERRRAHFHPRCRERPSMLSMQGLEKGTMGFQAALELGVADALQEEQWGFGSLGSKDRVIIDARKSLIASKDGLRRLDETTVLDHLIKNAQRYQQKHQKDRNSCHELYQELFSQILHPPNRTFTDPYSLSVQVLHLVKVLATPNVWIDFSHVEWRIRLGQILWGTADDDGDDSVSDGASITDAGDIKGLHEERYWLLLQILLACELLVRLDTITEGDEIPENVKPSEIHRFERDANPAVKWSLHLARAWLENIEITKAEPSTNGEHGNPRGWLANLTSKMAITSDRPHSRHHERHQDNHKQPPVYVMRGKYWDRQVRGLTHFARRLKWPEIETQSSLIFDNCRAVTEGTPLSTPFETPFSTISAKSKDSSYFAFKQGSLGRRPSRRQKVGAALHPAGWLSKSYVSGLMLPGEGIYHFIMSTLLENDTGAMHKLGPMANLCGGFVYSDKSFWSTACVVGRVLAAGKGAVECMGWISSDIIPHGLGDGWLNIDAEDIPEDVKKTGKSARIWGKLAVERESSVLGGSDRDSVLPADFMIPFENNYSTPPPTISVDFKSLNLTESMDSVQTTPTHEVATPFSYESAIPEIKNYLPSITFSVTTWEDDEDQEHTFHLSKDVNFVTSHPCVPSHHVKILKSPSSPTIQQIDLTGHPAPGNVRASGHSQKITCKSPTRHPLHKYYTYTSIHLSELLAKSTWTLNQLLADPAASNSPSIIPSSANARPPRVLVIDAITNFIAQPGAHEIPLSPVTSRASTSFSESSRHSSLSEEKGGESPASLKRTDTDFDQKNGGAAEYQMHDETRRRQFGSDMEMLVRAICAEKGWNAMISRRRRGCLACAIREAGALGWRVVIRVD
ncbi:hypothetical protein N0V93_009614 [Gnomoniopsis smithogilvyi]|uniref:Helicase-like protein n=1 Tax=Gnomoniopsis smithogilvyi TaxID=1191159 RepID=A0A9W8YLD9_9PEZI|nr:hypothetical protein N0V93_009614 [Gnomoniopsis smithogilvyi]